MSTAGEETLRLLFFFFVLRFMHCSNFVQYCPAPLKNCLSFFFARSFFHVQSLFFYIFYSAFFFSFLSKVAELGKQIKIKGVWVIRLLVCICLLKLLDELVCVYSNPHCICLPVSCICPCDEHRDVCDTNCCCDTDCGDEVAMFTSCLVNSVG